MRRKVWGILLTAALLTTSVPMASTVCAEDGFTDGETFSSQMEKDDWIQGETEDFQDEQSLEENVTEFSVDPEETIIDAGGETDELKNADYEQGEVRKLEIGKTYNILADLQPEYTYYKRFTASVDCPDAGRIKFVINDCNVVKYLRGDEGIHYTNEDTAETYWHTVNNETVTCEFQVTNLENDTQNFNPEATLTVKFESINDYNGELAGNHSFDQATPMRLNTLYEGSCIGTDYEDDYYKFVMEKPGSVVVTHSGALSAQVWGENGNGNTYSIRSFDNKQATLRLPAGIYYIVLSGRFTSNRGEYTVKADVTYESADDYEWENNNVKSKANEKKLNHWYTGNLNNREDVDCFRFNLTDKSVVSIEFQVPRQIKKELFKIALCDNSMNEIASASNGANPYLSFGNGIYDPGVYYIRVVSGAEFYLDDYSAYDYSFNFNQMKYIPVSEISIPSSVSVKKDEKISLNPVVIPDNAYNKELTWSTSDSKIAIVDQDGNVTGCNEGNALITAKANDDSGVSVTCAVKVYTVKVSEISLSANQMNVKPGDLFNLTVSINPSDAYNKSLEWTSSNDEIATVNNEGWVEAKNVGTAVITATSKDGSNISASCIISVENVKVSQITLSETIVNTESRSRFFIVATVNPTDAYDKEVKWSSSNSDVAYIDEKGRVETYKSGSAVITATATDGSNVSASCVINVTNKIIYQLNGGKNNSSNPTVINGDQINLKNPTRAGYIFKGWYIDGKKVAQIPAGYAADMKLVAKWEKVTVGKPVITSFYNKSGKKAVLKFKGVSKANGYQIVYSTDKKMKKKCTTITTKSKKYTLKKLSKKKTYYVKVRAYRIDSTGKMKYGKYTSVSKVKINK